MAKYKFVIETAHDNYTIKVYLKKALNISTRQITKLKAYPDGILLNSKHAIVTDLLHTDDILEINTHDKPANYSVSSIKPEIIYEDDNYIVVNKPANMTVYLCGKVKDNLLSSVCGYYESLGKHLTFRPFYRLDKDTSGLVVIGKNALIMNCTEIKKEYFAVCEGVVPANGIIDKTIRLEANSRIKREAGRGGDAAVTEFTTIKTNNNLSLVKLNLLTGRTHQIRVHLSSIGHPLCGDDLYGGHLDLISRQALHCGTVTIRCKMINFEKNISIGFPEDIKVCFPGLIKQLEF